MQSKVISKFFSEMINKVQEEEVCISMDDFSSYWEKEGMKSFEAFFKKQLKKVQKKEKKKEGAPKGIRSAYIFFCMDARAKIKEENPDIKSKEIMVEMGSRWKSLKEDNPKKFERYQEMAREDKERFSKEKEEFSPDEHKPSVEKKKTKKAKSAYLFFCDKMREDVKGRGYTGKEIMQELGRRWKQLKEDEDREDEYAEYMEMAQEDKKKKESEKKESEKEESDKEESDKEESEKEESEEEEKPKKKSKKETKKKTKKEVKKKSKKEIKNEESEDEE